MKKKLYYEAPEAEVFEVSFEGSTLMSSNPANAWHQGGAGSYGTDDTNDNGSY